MRRRHRDEHGAAMVIVIGLTAILTLLSIVALNYVRGAMPQARHHQDWHAALAAAEAGVDDYLARLNRDRFYYETATADDPQGNDALDPDTWMTLPDSEASFHYTVDDADAVSQGVVRVTSTGMVRGVTRTIEATLRPRTFLDFIYFTDFETVEPDIQPSGCANPAVYYPDRHSSCLDVHFIDIDVIRGPLHSNDALLLTGEPTFEGPVTTNYCPQDEVPCPEGTKVWRGSDDANFEAGPPTWAEYVDMPPNNVALSSHATGDAGGCIFYGPTYINVDGDRMRVSSPLSDLGAPGGNPAVPSSCTSTGNFTDTGWVDLPDSGVIFVGDHSSSACSSHPLGLPRPSQSGGMYGFPCHRGDVFAWGELEGRLTIGAERNLYVIWDLVYSQPPEVGDDLLGLIANRSVLVWHPVNTGGQDLPVTGTCQGGQPCPPFPFLEDLPAPKVSGDHRFIDARIDAAILSVQNSFLVDSFNRGGLLGDLTITGAISQRFRGPVGMFTMQSGQPVPVRGYEKDYVYDDRLRGISPPFFLEPTETQYRVRGWAEIRAPEDLPPIP